ELDSSLLAITNAVVRAEANLFPARQQLLLAAFHHVFLVEGPRIREVLQHDHEPAVGKAAHIQSIWQHRPYEERDASCTTNDRAVSQRVLREPPLVCLGSAPKW